MAKFLVAVWPFASHYFPVVAVAKALTSQGHEVRFYTGKSARPVLDEQGFASYAFTQIDEERIDEIMFSQSIYSSRRRPVQLQALLREWLLGTLPRQVTDLTDILANWQPDVVISETSMLAPMLVLRGRRPDSGGCLFNCGSLPVAWCGCATLRHRAATAAQCRHPIAGVGRAHFQRPAWRQVQTDGG